MDNLLQYNNMNQTTIIKFAVLLTLISFIASCAAPPTKRAPGEPRRIEAPVEDSRVARETAVEAPKDDPAKDLIENGRYLDAALLLTNIANSLAAPQKQDYQLRVAALLLQGNYIQQAEEILNQTDITNLDQDFFIQKSILAAQLSMAKLQPQQALSQLNRLNAAILSTSLERKKQFRLLQIDVFTALTDYANVARARAALETLLDDPVEILENQETLLRDLQELSPTELTSLSDNATDETMRGWFTLAYIAVSAADIEQATHQLTIWQKRFSDHPVQSTIVDTILSKQPEALGRPKQIAFILPMKGRIAKPARAIKNGFLAAYYADPNIMHRPSIKMYDEGNDPNQITAIYQTAIDEGADFVIGPLNKAAVANLAAYPDLKGGVLALNFGDNIETNPDNFFQLSLSPEQEAIHVAEHAWLDGHSKAAAIVPDSPWGTRVYNAFKSRWEELGGIIVEIQTYNTKKSDYGVPIKLLLNIDESEQRFRALRQTVKTKIEFEPRRRKDVDFIFMAANSRQGRLIRPQLRFHRASDIPVYATSHVFTGSLNPNMDRDMNGVKFSDMPWKLRTADQANPLKAQINKTWPKASKRYMPFFALGVDAFNIIPEINRLRRSKFGTFQGGTGVLYLDVNNRFQRRLLWAQFQKGKPKILAEY